MQILEDYWLTEEHEDLVDIRMLFIKGNEYQTKQIRWIRPDTMSEEPTDLNVTNLADLMSRIDKLKEDLTKFIEHENFNIGFLAAPTEFARNGGKYSFLADQPTGM